MKPRAWVCGSSVLGLIAATGGCVFSPHGPSYPAKGGNRGSAGSGGIVGGAGTGGTTPNVDGGADAPPPMGDFTLGTPADPSAWAATPVVGASAPAIVYPSN